jgi:hypothetical protein
MVSSWVGTRQRRILAVGYATGLCGRTRALSPRQLPTNHDHDGESLHLIHEYQSDQPSTTATPAAVHLCLTEKPPPRSNQDHLKGRSISAFRRLSGTEAMGEHFLRRFAGRVETGTPSG